MICPPHPGYCNSQDNGHHCGLKPHDTGAHTCICYWRWRSTDEREVMA